MKEMSMHFAPEVGSRLKTTFCASLVRPLQEGRGAALELPNGLLWAVWHLQQDDCPK